jgi:hypothetical protein
LGPQTVIGAILGWITVEQRVLGEEPMSDAKFAAALYDNAITNCGPSVHIETHRGSWL